MLKIDFFRFEFPWTNFFKPLIRQSVFMYVFLCFSFLFCSWAQTVCASATRTRTVFLQFYYCLFICLLVILGNSNTEYIRKFSRFHDFHLHFTQTYNVRRYEFIYIVVLVSNVQRFQIMIKKIQNQMWIKKNETEMESPNLHIASLCAHVMCVCVCV